MSSGATTGRRRRRTTSIRRCTSRAARWTRTRSMSREAARARAEVDVDRLELAAADARRVGTAARVSRCAPLYGGELLPENRYDDWVADRATSSRRWRRSCGRSSPRRAADGAARASGRRELVRRPRARARRVERVARPDAAAHTFRNGWRGQDAARARARAWPEEVVPGARRSSSSPRSPIRGSCRTLSPPRSTSARCPAQEIVDAVIDFLAPRELLLVVG